MRKLAAIGTLAFVLSIAVSPAVFAASSTAKVAAPIARVAAAVPASHHWKTTFTSATIHGSARLTIASTYASGRVSVSASGLKKGDKIVVTLTSGGTTLWTSHRTIKAASGKIAYSFNIVGKTPARKTALKSGSLSLTFTDGAATASGTFVKA
jgi:hypothetical protein